MRVMLSSDLPTEVPPYFWTTQGTLLSAEFRKSSSAEALPDEPFLAGKLSALTMARDGDRGRRGCERKGSGELLCLVLMV